MTPMRLDAGALTVEPFVMSPGPVPSHDESWITDDGPLAVTGTCNGGSTCVDTCP